MRRVVDPRKPCCEKTCAAALSSSVLVSIGRGTYMDARPECKYLLTYIRCLWGGAWFAPDHGRLAAGRRVVQEAIAQQPLALPALGLVRTRRSGWKRLYGYYLVEQRDVGENLAIRRCHRHSENRGLDGATTRQPELRPPDEIARAVDED